MSSLRQKIENGEKLLGTLVALTDPSVTEIFGNVGFDYIWIDTEHTAMSYKDVLCHLNAARSTGTPAIVRVPQNDLTATKKIIDMGPEGIIFPMVHNAKEANDLVKMTLYPPVGTRGFGPLRAFGYDPAKSGGFIESGHRDMCRFIQIEHVECIEELEKIVENPYIDGYIFGPNDLSGSIGELGRGGEQNTTDLINKAIKTLVSKGKYVGLAGGFDVDTIKHWASFGEIKMLTAGGDWNFLFSKGQQVLDDMKNHF